jgi:hypothetical protein
MEVRGVRISWLSIDMKSDLMRSSSVSRAAMSLKVPCKLAEFQLLLVFPVKTVPGIFITPARTEPQDVEQVGFVFFLVACGIFFILFFFQKVVFFSFSALHQSVSIIFLDAVAIRYFRLAISSEILPSSLMVRSFSCT